jgi:hypothetical protein
VTTFETNCEKKVRRDPGVDGVWQSKIAAKDDSEGAKDEGEHRGRREVLNSEVERVHMTNNT